MNKTKTGGVIAGVIMVLVVILFVLNIKVIPAGYVGVQYNINKGVEEKVLGQGWHLVSPTVKVKTYTVGLEQSYLTKKKKGDSRKDESFSASSSEGKALQIDLTYSYQFKSNKVSEVFTRFKGQDGEDVRDQFIKPNIVYWTKEVISRYKVSDILGSERANVNTALTEYLADKFEEYGITISNVSLIDITVDKKTREAINAKITAQQEITIGTGNHTRLCVTPARLPMIQYSMLASSFSGSAVSFSSIKRVCASACTAMPASTRFILLRPGAAAAKPSERNTAASPPAKAHTVVPSVPEETNKMANAAPTLAPDDTPMISGLARGFPRSF